MVTNDSQFGVSWHNKDLLLAHVIMSKWLFFYFYNSEISLLPSCSCPIWNPFFYCSIDIDHWKLIQVNLNPSDWKWQSSLGLMSGFCHMTPTSPQGIPENVGEHMDIWLELMISSRRGDGKGNIRSDCQIHDCKSGFLAPSSRPPSKQYVGLL